MKEIISYQNIKWKETPTNKKTTSADDLEEEEMRIKEKTFIEQVLLGILVINVLNK